MENHLIRMFNNQVRKYGNREVLRYRDLNGEYQPVSWNQLKKKVESIFTSLQSSGYTKGEMIGIFSPNKAEWLMADLGILALGGVVVPFYATASRDQLKYIVDETGMKLMFVGNQDQLDVALSLMDGSTSLEKLVLLGPYSGNDKRISGLEEFLGISGNQVDNITIESQYEIYDPGDLATVIYTSGTTGEPKGVMLSHENFMYCFDIHDQRLNVTSNDISLCFLPLSHVFERLWSHYMMHCGAVNVMLENPREVIEVLPKVRPSLMCTVPRFFDKTFQGIKDELNKWPSVKQKIFHWSIAQGMKASDYRSRSKKIPTGLSFKLMIADKLVLSKLRNIFGGRIKAMPCSGASINTEVLKFFHAIGIFVNYGYGATETTATGSCFKTDNYLFGTCGTVMPGVAVKIGEGSEILVKGKSVFSGYFKKDAATAEVFTEGWFHTGDEGYLDDMGNLIMVDRIKDLMKTSVGKYVSPQKLELILTQDQLVEQIIVVGDNRKYVSALVVPAFTPLKELAPRLGIEFQEEEDLLENPQITRLFETRFASLQENLTPHERVIKIALLPEPFSIEGGTMTSTLKLRRRIIELKYKDIIDKLYT